MVKSMAKNKLFKYIIFLLALSPFGNLFAQAEFEFSGYIYNLPIIQFQKAGYAEFIGSQKTGILDLTRIRLKPDLFLWESARLSMEYEITALAYNSINGMAVNFGGQTNRQAVNLSWNFINEKNIAAMHFIDRLYFRQGFNFGNIIIGRQRISWGTGRIWNPTDLFNPINPATYYKYEKDGADAVSSKINFGNFTDLNLVYNPADKFHSANFGGRFRTNFDEFDVSVMGGYFDKNIVVGGDFAGNLFEAGIRGEGIYSYNKNNTENNFIRFILGADYQFTSKFYSLIEYQFNGEGKKDISDYDLSSLAKGEIINLGRNYINIMSTYQYTPLLILTLGSNTNLNDGSGYILLSGSYSAAENVYLTCGSQYSYGGKLSEYWYYPASIYGQIEYYF